MTKRIVSLLIALVLALGCAFAVAETTTEGKTRYISARRGLNIRAAADLEAEIVATPDFNYTVRVVGEEGKWSQVVYESNGQVYEGYCWTAYLSDHKIVVTKVAAKSDDDSGNYIWVEDENRYMSHDEYEDYLRSKELWG